VNQARQRFRRMPGSCEPAAKAGASDPEQLVQEQLALLLDGASARSRSSTPRPSPPPLPSQPCLSRTPSPRQRSRPARARTCHPQRANRASASCPRLPVVGPIVAPLLRSAWLRSSLAPGATPASVPPAQSHAATQTWGAGTHGTAALRIGRHTLQYLRRTSEPPARPRRCRLRPTMPRCGALEPVRLRRRVNTTGSRDRCDHAGYRASASHSHAAMRLRLFAAGRPIRNVRTYLDARVSDVIGVDLFRA
jgi:hypothetical protein